MRDPDPRRPSLADRPREDSVSRESVASVVGDEEEEEEKEKMNLDKFLANHTSEDNESFKEIQEEGFARHR
jgi:hypothetical protein